jgi:hypothetical protein
MVFGNNLAKRYEEENLTDFADCAEKTLKSSQSVDGGVSPENHRMELWHNSKVIFQRIVNVVLPKRDDILLGIIMVGECLNNHPAFIASGKHTFIAFLRREARQHGSVA